ncbi:hypothetical protein D9C73_010992 [Collichthys lucidus]|uniref:Uncharacterized protein n=1 Tax=Collichthys lucidus TaxID=240159 RepID=A0A4V6XYP1_COLLU|nr:hypothetical protein D9C73_010992 [Collichthys lucidus]
MIIAGLSVTLRGRLIKAVRYGSHSTTPEPSSRTRSGSVFIRQTCFIFGQSKGSEEVAEQRIKGPVTRLSPPLINQSGVGIVLSQPLGAAHVRMQGEEEEEGVDGGRGASQPAGVCSGLQQH